MAIARHGHDGKTVIAAFISQVHPVFMLPPVATALYGALLGRSIRLANASHLIAIFAAVYTAHVVDGYVDFHVRSEDDDHPLTARGCKLALIGATVTFWMATTAVYILAGLLPTLLTIPCWLIGYHHAPELDTNPITATTGYPIGVALSLLGGNAITSYGLKPIAIGSAAVFVVLLSGVKIIDDLQDYEYDRHIEKMTVGVTLGQRRGRNLAHLLLMGGIGLVPLLIFLRIFTPGTILAPIAFGFVVLTARGREPEISTKLLIRGSYVFLALLIATTWFRPWG
ncbi:MAG: ubiquinone biosynthesis protein UbiA [Halobacteriaceae archaeon]